MLLLGKVNCFTCLSDLSANGEVKKEKIGHLKITLKASKTDLIFYAKELRKSLQTFIVKMDSFAIRTLVTA